MRPGWQIGYVISTICSMMTGYGRTLSGSCLCFYDYTNTEPRHSLHYLIAKWKYLREVPQFDVRDLINEGARIAQRAQWMAEIEWEQRLAEPLEQVRQELGFEPPERYWRLRQQAPGLLAAA